MHDVVSVGVPIMVILAGIVFNRNDVKELRNEAAARHAEVLARLSTIDGDLRQFYHLTGKLEGRMDAIEKREQRLLESPHHHEVPLLWFPPGPRRRLP